MYNETSGLVYTTVSAMRKQIRNYRLVSLRRYFILFLFLVGVTACDDASGPGPIQLSHDPAYSMYNGKTYCLAQDMEVWQLLLEAPYPKLEKYLLVDNHTTHGENTYYSTILIPKGTRVTFKEVWTFDDPSNKSKHGWVWFLGEIHDGKTRDTLVNISRLVGGQSTLTNFDSEIQKKYINECE